MSKTISYIVGFFLVFAIAASVGLGVWSYQLNTRLQASQKQLASLQNDFNKLKAEDAQLKADNDQISATLAQTQSNLDQTKSELAKTQADLKAANSNGTVKQAKLDKAKKFLSVADAILINGESDSSIKAKVNATGDSSLIDLLDTLIRTPNIKNYNTFNDYLFSTLDDAVN